MSRWMLLLGLLAVFLVLALLRRRVLRQPGDRLGQGSHDLEGRGDGTAVAVATDDKDARRR